MRLVSSFLCKPWKDKRSEDNKGIGSCMVGIRTTLYNEYAIGNLSMSTFHWESCMCEMGIIFERYDGVIKVMETLWILSNSFLNALFKNT